MDFSKPRQVVLDKVMGEYPEIKVLIPKGTYYRRSLGAMVSSGTRTTFEGYLPREDTYVETLSKDEAVQLLNACTNVRDKLQITLMAETGMRAGKQRGRCRIHEFIAGNVQTFGREDRYLCKTSYVTTLFCAIQIGCRGKLPMLANALGRKDTRTTELYLRIPENERLVSSREYFEMYGSLIDEEEASL